LDKNRPAAKIASTANHDSKVGTAILARPEPKFNDADWSLIEIEEFSA
jgi:hypothetical protein